MEMMGRQFLAQGGVHPRGWPQGRSQLRAECLIEGLDPQIEISLRFLQAVERQVLDAEGQPVDDIVVAEKPYVSEQETIERELHLATLPNRTATVRTAGSKEVELIEKGAVAGSLRWHWESLHCTVEAWIDDLERGVRRLRVEVANRLEWDGGGLERTLLRTLHSPQIEMHESSRR